MTNLIPFCESYFQGFQEISSYQKNDAKTTAAALVKILSYFTVVIPAVFGMVYGLSLLYGRVTQKDVLTPKERQVNEVALSNLSVKSIPSQATSNVETETSKTKAPDRFSTIPPLPKSTLEDHPAENCFPDHPIDFFQHFQVNCNGKEISFHEGFGCYQGPLIARYDNRGNHFGALLSRIQLTPEMAKKLPHLPQEVNGRSITDAFVNIWGNMPKAENCGPHGRQLMFQIQTLLVGQIPNSGGSLEEGHFPLNIGLFTDPQLPNGGGIIPVDRSAEFPGNETGLSVNDGLNRCQYDSHSGYFTSIMGTFELDQEPVHAFTVVATLDPNEEQYQGFKGINKTMAFYQIVLSDELTTYIAPIIHQSQNLRQLMSNLHDYWAALDGRDPVTARLLKQPINDLITIFSANCEA